MSAPSPPEGKDSKGKGEERDESKQKSNLERVKIEVCFSEEGKEKGEEQWLDIWEEGTGAAGFSSI